MAVAPEGFCEVGGERDGAQAVLGFGGVEASAVAAAADVQLPVAEVDVVTFQGDCFADAQAGVGEELEEEPPLGG